MCQSALNFEGNLDLNDIPSITVICEAEEADKRLSGENLCCIGMTVVVVVVVSFLS